MPWPELDWETMRYEPFKPKVMMSDDRADELLRECAAEFDAVEHTTRKYAVCQISHALITDVRAYLNEKQPAAPCTSRLRECGSYDCTWPKCQTQINDAGGVKISCAPLPADKAPGLSQDYAESRDATSASPTMENVRRLLNDAASDAADLLAKMYAPSPLQQTATPQDQQTAQPVDDPRICKARPESIWGPRDNSHYWQTRYFQDEPPRDMCAYCDVDRADVEHDAKISDKPVAWIWCGMDGPGTKTLRWRKTNQWEWAPEGETPLYAAPAVQPIPRDRVYWVLERFENEKSQGYWDGGSSRSFTFDINKAVQFCRKEDVFWVTRGWHWNDCEPVEHMDMAGPNLTEGKNG